MVNMRDEIRTDLLSVPGSPPVEWRIEPERVSYPDAIAVMEERVAAIADGKADELVWLIEHPPLYTAGTSANPADLIAPDRFPVYAAGRGGQYTYHGPGQRVAYVMLDLNRRARDIPRNSAEAQKALRAIPAAEAVQAVLDLLRTS